MKFDTENDFRNELPTRVRAKNVRILSLAQRSGFRRWIQIPKPYRSGSTRRVFVAAESMLSHIN